MKIYSNSFYGSNLWDLGGDKAKQVYNAWSTSVKLAWGCPQQTRTYFVQKLLCCGLTSAKTDILSRYVKFFNGLRSSASLEVQVLSRLVARDRQAVTGKNLCLIRELTGLNPWNTSSAKFKSALQVHEAVNVPDLDQWRLPYLVTLLK